MESLTNTCRSERCDWHRRWRHPYISLYPYGRSSSEWRQCFCKQKKTNKLCKKCAQSILYSSRKIVINQKRWAYKYIWKRQRQGQSIQRVWFRQERAKPIRSSSATTTMYLKHLHRRPPPGHNFKQSPLRICNFSNSRDARKNCFYHHFFITFLFSHRIGAGE